jgi:hypothetical protein
MFKNWGAKVPKTKEKIYDVVCVSTETFKVLWVDPNHKLHEAEAIERMAIARQGVEDRFFNSLPHGEYEVGDEYKG